MRRLLDELYLDHASLKHKQPRKRDNGDGGARDRDRHRPRDTSVGGGNGGTAAPGEGAGAGLGARMPAREGPSRVSMAAPPAEGGGVGGEAVKRKKRPAPTAPTPASGQMPLNVRFK